MRAVSAEDGAHYERILRGLKPIGPDMRVEVTGGMNRPPYERNAANGALFETARAVAARTGLDLHEVPRTGGGSDGNFTAALGVATLDGLGVDGDGAHTLKEYADIPSLRVRQRLMAGLLRELR